MKEEFEDYSIKFVVLLVDEKTLLLRDKERPEDYQMKERCITLLNSFKASRIHILVEIIAILLSSAAS